MRVFSLLVFLILIYPKKVVGQVEFRVSIDFFEESNSRKNTTTDDILKELCSLINNYSIESNKNYCKNLGKKIFEDGAAKVDIFSTNDFWESDGFKKYIRESSFSSAYITSYFKNKRIPLKDALTGNYTGNVKKDDKIQLKWNRRKQQFKETGIQFRICLDYNSENGNSDNQTSILYELCETIMSFPSNDFKFKQKDCRKLKRDIKRLKRDDFLYVRQGHQDYWVIDKLKSYLQNKGFESSFLASFKDGKRVALTDVLETM